MIFKDITNDIVDHQGRSIILECDHGSSDPIRSTASQGNLVEKGNVLIIVLNSTNSRFLLPTLVLNQPQMIQFDR